MTTEEKPLELLTLVTAFMRQKYPKKKKIMVLLFVRNILPS